MCVADRPVESLSFLLVRSVGAGVEVHPSIGRPVVLDANGVATFTGVHAGLWQVRLQRFGAVSTRDGVPVALATVNVVSGASVSVPVDVRPVTPGRLNTIVEPRDDEPIELKALDYGHTFRIEPIAGHVTTEALFPGRYRVVRPSDGASTTFTLLPGTTFREPLRLVK